MLDLNDVALFVSVVRNGSFAEAARQLGMPSNTLSRRVQQLELQLGTRLLQRSTRKLTLTHSGQVFHEQCLGAVQSLIGAAEQLTMGSQEPHGTVRVAAMADFFDYFPMEWVADFLAEYPRVHLDFVLSDARADLIADRIDIAFRGGTLHDSSYVGRQLIGAGNEGLVASPDYVNKRGLPTTLEDLIHHDCVSFGHPSGVTIWRLNGPNGIEENVQITSRFSGNTAQALRRATLVGLGIALLPPAMINGDLQAGRLVSVLPQYHRTGYGLHVLYPSRQHLPLAVTAFIELVMNKLKAQAFPANRE